MAGYIGSKSSVTLVDGYSEAEADAEFVNDPNSVITVSGSNVGIGTSSSYPLTVQSGTAGSNHALALRNSSNNFSRLGFLQTDSATAAYTSIDGDGRASGYLKFNTNDTERMQIDSSGNVGIGITPESWSSSYTALQFAGNGALSGWGNQQHGAAIFLSQNSYVDASGWKYISTDEASRYEQVNGAHTWSTAASGTADTAISWSEAMRIDLSGNVLINRTSQLHGGRLCLDYIGGTDAGIVLRDTTSSGTGVPMQFANGATTIIGSITHNQTSTSFNTSSDYRLKEDWTPMTGASARVQALNPINFAWIADGSRVDGFLAHELAEVTPEAVTGTKDAMKDEEYEVTPAVLDEDGNVTTEAVMGTRSVPDYQGIDQSKLVPLLTAALQEALTEIASLKTRVQALEDV